MRIKTHTNNVLYLSLQKQILISFSVSRPKTTGRDSTRCTNCDKISTEISTDDAGGWLAILIFLRHCQFIPPSWPGMGEHLRSEWSKSSHSSPPKLSILNYYSEQAQVSPVLSQFWFLRPRVRTEQPPGPCLTVIFTIIKVMTFNILLY